MDLLKGMLIGASLFLAISASGAEYGPDLGRDQVVLNAILKVEQRYLDEDNRDPNVGYSRVLSAEVRSSLYGGGRTEIEAAQGQTARKAKYLEKLLKLKGLTTAIVVDAYKQAEKTTDHSKLEAYKDLVKELKLKDLN
jgi:hypothetical protein